jgi:uncharacterized membrane protein required for colicin V production
MVFWIGILVGCVCGLLLVRRGLCESWALFWNTLISVYLALFLWPVISKAAGPKIASPYSAALTVLVTALVVFALLYVLAHIFFSGQLNVSFPRVLGSTGSGLLGFLAGLIVWGFLLVVVSMTPMSEDGVTREIRLTGKLDQSNISYLCWWCDMVNKVAARDGNKITCKQAIENLLQDARSRNAVRTSPAEDAIEGQTTADSPATSVPDSNL